MKEFDKPIIEIVVFGGNDIVTASIDIPGEISGK